MSVDGTGGGDSPLGRRLRRGGLGGDLHDVEGVARRRSGTRAPPTACSRSTAYRARTLSASGCAKVLRPPDEAVHRLDTRLRTNAEWPSRRSARGR
jgi:hypothetical protein